MPKFPPAIDIPGVVRKIDLGTVTAADLMANGPRTLYTPSAGEYVDIKFASGVDVANGWQIGFDPAFTIATYPYFQGEGVGYGSANLEAGGYATLLFPASPIEAVLSSQGNLLRTPVGVWAADHAYAVGDAVRVTLLDGDHIEVVTTAGTSAHTGPPDFQTNAGGTTPEGPNTLVWTDGGLAPTTGSVQVVALVAK